MHAVLKQLKYISLALLLALFVASCGASYNKLLKSGDFDKKLEAADKYYENEQYDKAIPLYEELIPIRKGTSSINDIYYKYAMAHYYQANYIIAGFHFKNIHDSYPNSVHAEESLYMSAFCDYMMSPEVPLDQSYTNDAIDAFQLFINSYPTSDKISEANQLIEQLRRKLEVKALNAAELYLKMELYKAAVTSLSNILIDFPDTRDAEKISFLVVKANYLYADNSIQKRQYERYKDVVAAFKIFEKKYPNSIHMSEALKYYEQTVDRISEIENPDKS